MNKEDAKKWLEYHNAGIKPTRVKFSGTIYSDMAVSSSLHFDLNGCELSLRPIDDKTPKRILEGYSPAFICEVTYIGGDRRGGSNRDLEDAVERVFPLMGFDYRVAPEYEQWEEYDGSWLKVLSPSMWGSMQSTYKEVPNKNIQAVVGAYEALSLSTRKRAKKAVALRGRLKEAVMLQNISRRYSFLSFYGIVEIVSDDLCSERNCPSGDAVAIEMARFSLGNKGSQRSKLYFLLKAVVNNFDIDKCMELPELRNDIAHGESSVPYEHFELCKRLAFWASESFALEVASSVGA